MEHAFRRGVKPVGRRGPLANAAMPRVARHPSVAGLPELAKQDGDRFYTFPGEVTITPVIAGTASLQHV